MHLPNTHLPTVQEISALLSAGGIIVFPTETFYGLGCDPWNLSAVERIFALKGRPDGKPLPLVIPRGDPAKFGIHLTPIAQDYAVRHWPAPLTLVVPATGFPAAVTAGTDTVAVRRSPHPFLADLMAVWAKPLIATSANRSGEPALVDLAGVRKAFPAGVDVFVDGGRLPGKLGSTVLDCTGEKAVVLRAGDFPFEAPPNR